MKLEVIKILTSSFVDSLKLFVIMVLISSFFNLNEANGKDREIKELKQQLEHVNEDFKQYARDTISIQDDIVGINESLNEIINRLSK